MKSEDMILGIFKMAYYENKVDEFVKRELRSIILTIFQDFPRKKCGK